MFHQAKVAPAKRTNFEIENLKEYVNFLIRFYTFLITKIIK